MIGRLHGCCGVDFCVLWLGSGGYFVCDLYDLFEEWIGGNEQLCLGVVFIP